MHAIVVSAPGGADSLTYTEVERPTASPGGILVRTEAIGVNFVDTYFRSGVYSTEFPWTPGAEGAGTVIEISDDVSTVSVGDRVAWSTSRTGSYAEYVELDAAYALPVPDDMDLRLAATLPLQALTVHMLAQGVTTLREGDTVFITAGAGGVGSIFIPYAKSLGARVLTMVGTPEKAALARDSGADAVYVASDFTDLTADLTAALRGDTDGRGVDVFYDGLGKVTFDAAVASVRPRGLIVLFGGASGQVPPFDLQRLNAAGSLFVTRPTMGHYTADPEERAQRWADIIEAVNRGIITPKVGAEFPLSEATAAHNALEGRQTTGKVLLIP